MWLFRLRRFLRSIGREGLMLVWSLRHPATPLGIRLATLALFAYAISPVDLIPDVPGLGWLDDAAILMIGIPFLLKRLPVAVRDDAGAAIGRLLARFGVRGSTP
jgi:uncharacterized membrane protein YkvA (DUF1232 family)